MRKEREKKNMRYESNGMLEKEIGQDCMSVDRLCLGLLTARHRSTNNNEIVNWYSIRIHLSCRTVTLNWMFSNWHTNVEHRKKFQLFNWFLLWNFPARAYFKVFDFELSLNELVWIYPNLSEIFWICPNLSKFVLFYPNLFEFIQICPNWSKLARNHSNLSESVQIRSNVPKPIRIRPNLSEPKVLTIGPAVHSMIRRAITVSQTVAR